MFFVCSVVYLQIGRVSAVDRDSEQFSGFEYKLQSSSELFSIDSDTGEITAKVSLDREERSIHRLVVVASDLRAPAMSSTADVSVQV